ncbi:hypothetical protein [Mycolicibacter arupensis]|uniref:Uncharacterized protein n=1 Tax=Mycolicibacter arupensis TaxID=342002 RepID=A0A0F5MZK3_9MYCO|nr:hypothetical protein [Mycolicibacter arupensis]KKB99462.1 hypothetical protein WR43_09595 [Mycolicibacter arupensis]MCV7277072.1 hypothetical protein [Mycolicibacter arupensis]OQZ91194.1 hypothetical protein BST15_20230 [Mycolicibacter arupensis]TXI54458.1 MAG: hypothetical protein E6Q54_14755 [Mycolicibacter arupensis]
MTASIASQPDPPNYRHARDIPDVVFLAAVSCCQDPMPGGDWYWALRDDVTRVLGGLDRNAPVRSDEVPGVPWKVVLAKFRRVKKRGLVDGCDCGCRGDFELTSKGRELLFDALIAETDAYLAAVEVLINFAGMGNGDQLTAIWKGIKHSAIHQLGLTATALSGAATELDLWSPPDGTPALVFDTYYLDSWDSIRKERFRSRTHERPL